MAKRKKRESSYREIEPPVDERIAVALERIADSLEAFEDAAIYDNEGDAPFVGVSVNHSPEVVGDDVFANNSANVHSEDEG